MTKQQVVKIGMIGLGVISKYYLRAIEAAPSLELTAVCDLDDERLKAVNHMRIFTTNSSAQLLEREVDAVIVNVPNDQHFAICREALLAGKHVCCEKPLAVNALQAGELTAIARTRDRVLHTAFHRRYNTNVCKAKETLAHLGQPARVRAHYFEKIEDHCGSDNWYLQAERCGGGCIADNGPNVFDTLIELFGELRVTGALSERSDRGTDMQAALSLHDGRGMPIHVELDWEYKLGEKKDILLEYENALVEIDMLAGSPGFKNSLWHEYVGLLQEFCERVVAGRTDGDRGYLVAEMVRQAYELDERTRRR
jgi:L-arabinose 1-dehydrogenase